MEQSGQEGRRPANDGPKAAARNRAALVTAARETFAERGLEAPLSAIARRARVGQGVLYRHFPDRAALVSAVLEENVRQIEQAADAEDATLPGLLGVLTWHLAESAAFIGLLHSDRAGDRSAVRAHSSALSERVQLGLRAHLPQDHPLTADDLELAVAMVSAAVIGPTREERVRRALAAWRLLGVQVGPVLPFGG
ncbi:TetR/AcrR family transcriptional regulator [Streptomyces microflavus]|uniref:Helix-turn-helix domain-containing protein n=1 Tax=Streptomyces microflavus TaxID=1919 RepID=A0A6N9VB31_STRMI|nr:MULTISPECIES: helix-turn-helix domain-containing protein [Streptomyces]NEE50843.1 helix-turn-helix transcriptional regulator [Streptomyces sp. SID8455]MBK5994218.1 helix-turn-helix transcriptional regulator [Streptomyces sp. MBT58]MBW3356819.1 TetR/AcrR family transcriptional regulator [Streptomyces sp. 09ZI22]MEE1732899.1 helix-turn-helix domain containing protein [Streptomyces sp. BE282]NEB70030.1 helix-turn-helix transcriptional regulator [Streptomyces microflavus]